jgi:hypothetical protein
VRALDKTVDALLIASAEGTGVEEQGRRSFFAHDDAQGGGRDTGVPVRVRRAARGGGGEGEENLARGRKDI